MQFIQIGHRGFKYQKSKNRQACKMHFETVSSFVCFPKEITLVQLHCLSVSPRLLLPACLRSEPIHRCQQNLREEQRCQQNMFHENQEVCGEGSTPVEEKGSNHDVTEVQAAVWAYKVRNYHTRVNTQEMKLWRPHSNQCFNQSLNLTGLKSARGQESIENRFLWNYLKNTRLIYIG